MSAPCFARGLVANDVDGIDFELRLDLAFLGHEALRRVPGPTPQTIAVAGALVGHWPAICKHCMATVYFPDTEIPNEVP